MLLNSDLTQVDKEGEPGAQRKVTRAIKFLSHSEEALRFEVSVNYRVGVVHPKSTFDLTGP